MVQRIVVSVLKIGLILNRKSSSTEGAELGSCRWDTASRHGIMGLFHLARVTIHDRWVARPTFRAPSRFSGRAPTSGSPRRRRHTEGSLFQRAVHLLLCQCRMAGR